MQLPVKLTDDELRYRGDELARLTKEVDDLEFEKKESQADYKAKIDARRVAALKLADAIKAKTEVRDVEVCDTTDHDARKVYTVRQDTGEVVNSRPATTEDLQEDMFPEGGDTTLRAVK